MSEFIEAYREQPIGMTWRLLVLPLTFTLLHGGRIAMGLSQLIAYGKWEWAEL